MASFTKLFSSIITSTVWMEDDQTRIVWITMLALADKNGEVQGSVPGLARIAGVPLESCRLALKKFLSPDPDSRTTTDEGRRIEEIDGGWSLLNYSKYRKMASKEEQIEKATARTRRYRARRARNDLSTPVHDISTEAEAEAEAKTDSNESVSTTRKTNERSGTRLPDDWRPSADLRSFAADLGLDPDSTADAFCDYWHGRAGAGGRKADWPATWRNWCRKDADQPKGRKRNGAVQSARGNDPFLERLASIASRDGGKV